MKEGAEGAELSLRAQHARRGSARVVYNEVPG